MALELHSKVKMFLDFHFLGILLALLIYKWIDSLLHLSFQAFILNSFFYVFQLLKKFPKDLLSWKRVEILCFYMGRPDLSLPLFEKVF